MEEEDEHMWRKAARYCENESIIPRLNSALTSLFLLNNKTKKPSAPWTAVYEKKPKGKQDLDSFTFSKRISFIMIKKTKLWISFIQQQGELAIVAVSRENCLHNTDGLKEQSSQA